MNAGGDAIEHKMSKPRNAYYGLLIIMIVYAAFFIACNLQGHAAFQTAGFDLGNYDQAMWNTLHGKPLAMTTVQSISSRWAAHFEPILLLLVPIYAVFNSPQTLLIWQTVIVALGAVPIFLLACRNLAGNLTGLVFAIVYLLFPALQAAITFDFHAVAMASTFLSFALWFLATRRYRLLAVMTLLAMSCKEEISLLVLMMGIYVWLVQRQRRWGAAIIAAGALWFALVNLVIIPATSPTGENIQLYRYSRWGDDMGQIIANLLLHPFSSLEIMFSGDRLRYWLRATMPVAFTALLDPFTLLMAVPTMAINTLSSFPPNYQLDRFHYSITIVPFVAVASINGLRHLIDFAKPHLHYASPIFLRNVLMVMVLSATLAYQVQFGYAPLGRYFAWPQPSPRRSLIETFLAMIPAEASVSAQNNLVAHLSQREQIYIYPKIAHDGHQAEYILLDWGGSIVPFHKWDDYCRSVAAILTDDRYGLIAAQDGLLLLQRNRPNRVTVSSQSCFDWH
ncbi:MAG TPA: DUF2079 domain-containing protein [Anaerolineae bacterium]|nr:DUF2079 domain-containing protein [Anaerolineae bacterium]